MEDLIIRSKNYEENSKKYNEKLTLKFQIENIINEINVLKENNKISSVLTDYNLERITVKNVRMSILYSYILSILIGIGFAIIFVIVQDNIRVRSLNDRAVSNEMMHK